MKLTEFSKNTQIVVNFPHGSNHEAVLRNIEEALNTLFNHWAFIVHDKDVDEKTGKRKTEHIHIVTYMTGRSRRLQSTLNSFCELALLPSECVSILPCVDLNRSIRYLIHADNSDKYLYLWGDVKTDSRSWLSIHQKKEMSISIDFLINLIKEHDGNQLNIARALGLQDFQKYRGIIHQLCDSAICEKNRENSNERGEIESNDSEMADEFGKMLGDN